MPSSAAPVLTLFSKLLLSVLAPAAVKSCYYWAKACWTALIFSLSAVDISKKHSRRLSLMPCSFLRIKSLKIGISSIKCPFLKFALAMDVGGAAVVLRAAVCSA